MPEHTRREAAYRVAILVVSLVSIVIVTADLTLNLKPELHDLFELLDVLVCVVLLLDFGRQLLGADDRWRYMRTWGWVDLLSSIPAVDALRYGRMVRVVRLFQVLRLIRSARMVWLVLRDYRARATCAAALTVAVLAVSLGSIAVLALELQHEEPGIEEAGDALWWSIVTMTTVGYGDVYPATPGGRAVAVALMFVGIGLFASMSAVLASWILGEDEGPNSSASDESAMLRQELAALRAQLDRVERAIDQRPE